jgi:hypothetical protein
VRAESRDGNTLTCGWAVTLKWFCSRVPSARGTPLLNLSQREAEGEGSHATRLKDKGLACDTLRDGQELKLPRLVSAKN